MIASPTPPASGAVNKPVTQKAENTKTPHNRPENGRRSTSGKDATRASDSQRDFDSNLFQSMLQSPGHFAFADIRDASGRQGGGTLSSHSPLIAQGLNSDDLFTDLLSGIAENATGGDFECTLILPRLGEVAVAATRTPAKWLIQLDFAQAQSFDRCRANHRRLKKELAEELGQSVQLDLRHRGRQHKDEGTDDE